jgi:hypothetical protein
VLDSIQCVSKTNFTDSEIESIETILAQ